MTRRKTSECGPLSRSGAEIRADEQLADEVTVGGTAEGIEEPLVDDGEQQHGLVGCIDSHKKASRHFAAGLLVFFRNFLHNRLEKYLTGTSQ